MSTTTRAYIGRVCQPAVTAVGVWAVVASIFVAENVVGTLALHQRLQWLPVLWFELEYWLVFLVCTPWFVYMGRRFRVEPGRFAPSLAAHAAAGVAFAVAQPLVADTLNYVTLAMVTVAGDPRRAAQLASSIRLFPLLAVIAFWKYAVVIAV